MNVYDFILDMGNNEYSAYSLSEGHLNPDTGYLAKVPKTEEFFDKLTTEHLREYMTKHIGELFQPGRYILCRNAAGHRLSIGILLSYPSATELTQLHGGSTIYDCSARRMELI